MEGDSAAMKRASGRETDKVVATLAPSGIRRSLGIGGLAALGVILAYVAAAGRDASVSSLTLAVAAALAVLLAYKMLVSTSKALELRTDGLYTSDGMLIASISNVRQVELGVFAFKPSNGFLIVLKQPMAGSWNPGLWWRFGRRVGIGGVTPRAEGKVMAEAMTLLLREYSRDAG